MESRLSRSGVSSRRSVGLLRRRCTATTRREPTSNSRHSSADRAGDRRAMSPLQTLSLAPHSASCEAETVGMTSSPHDALFKSAFENPQHAAAELRHILPTELTHAIDWSSLRLEPGSFIDPKLADRHSDLLF